MIGLHLFLSEVDTDPEMRFVSFKSTTSNESSLFVALQDIAQQLASRCFFEGLQNYIQNKTEGNERKIMLGDLNCTMYKIDSVGENKTQTIYRCLPVTPCLNSSWIIDMRNYRERRTNITRSSSATIGPLPRIEIDRFYTDIKMANNTKINHIMVPFTN